MLQTKNALTKSNARLAAHKMSQLKNVKALPEKQKSVGRGSESRGSSGGGFGSEGGGEDGAGSRSSSQQESPRTSSSIGGEGGVGNKAVNAAPPKKKVCIHHLHTKTNTSPLILTNTHSRTHTHILPHVWPFARPLAYLAVGGRK